MSDVIVRELVSALRHDAGERLAEGRNAAAFVLLAKAFLAAPDDPESLEILAALCRLLGRWDDLERFSRLHLGEIPHSAAARCHLAGALLARRRFVEALELLQRAAAEAPRHRETWIELGRVWKRFGEVERALDCFRSALRLDPASAAAHDNLVFTMLFSDRYPPEELFRAHLEWGERHAPTAAPPSSLPPPSGRLVIGYLSPDFREHSVASFLEPVLASHDRACFEIVCYQCNSERDEVTRRLQALSDRWRDVSAMGDDQAADLIRDDGVHILVDLAGHTAGNRLLLIARRPAPLQVTWLGYPHSTGMKAVDYRITDTFSDPPGMTEQWHTERLMRLPRTFLSYHPPDAPEPAHAPPCLHNGRITFGCFNNFAKASPAILACWRTIMSRVPDSRLLLKAEVLGDPEAHRMVLERLGIPAGRVMAMGTTPDRISHLALYNQVDIALDTFPYHGTTTTCEALYMGVPVVTLTGRHHAARVGLSILNSVGLGELAADSVEGYVSRCVGLARDTARLSQLRGSLRGTMAASPLMDGKGFTAALEDAYREMWKNFIGDGLGP